MSVVLPTVLCLIAYVVAYWLYARFLSRRIYALDPNRRTPAHTLQDGVDYVPTRRSIVFGHHFASITGLAPMLGPAVAVIWGWVPAMIWVVLGAVFVGCVHDFSALVLSLRARGMSIGKVAEGVLGPRAKTLFHLVIFFGIALAMGVFVFAIGNLFDVTILGKAPGYPAAVTPSVGLMVIALCLGYLLYRKGMPLVPLAAVAFLLGLLLVYVGHLFPTLGLDPASWPSAGQWIWALLGYALLASILPVWVLLQARDFVNSLLLYLGLGAAYVGVFVAGPTFQAPAIRLEVEGAPNIVPFVFIIIACGAASGFHGLVSSGTTAKQLWSERDATFVGYGGMIAESSLGLLAVLATTAGAASVSSWHERYATWGSVSGNLPGNIGAFISGAARFISALGVEHGLASSFVAVVVVSFALTTLDSATRLLRYNIEEIGDTVRASRVGRALAARAESLRAGQPSGGRSMMASLLELRWWGNRYVSSLIAVAVIGMFAFYKVDGKAVALALWTLFGTTNQLLAALTLVAATLYLKQRNKPALFTGVPAVFMLGSTLTAMAQNLSRFVSGEQIQWLLLVVGGILFVLALWIVVEAVLVLVANRQASGWEIDFDVPAALDESRRAP